MKNVDTSLGEAPSIAERLRWGGSHGTALYFLLTVSTFPRHRCGGRCSSCRGQRMLLSLRDCRSAHHQNILSCAGMLSCTFPEIQHFRHSCTFCTPHFFYINSNKPTADRTKAIHRRLELSCNLYLLLLFVGQNRASKSHLHITLRISRFLQFFNK